ncbi:hypothetical protein ANN_07986 [Periplaneta americana]|uniref:Uncharacterized protein n=1 Tax=Periplaneta americana TaxID=6978 RepID=A0ABQ8T056_PERAM|nr:hypothetical protein ANN_07986 [Periplaneta americana]
MGNESVVKTMSSGRPVVRRTSATVQQLSNLILTNRRITFDELQMKQHDNARPYTSRQTCDTLTSVEFQALPHPPYFPALVLLDYALFDKIKKNLCSQQGTTTCCP